MSLPRKILLLALLNFLLLAALTGAVARFQFGLQAESLLLGPVRDRLTALGNDFSMEYETTAPGEREKLAARWSRQCSAEVYVTKPRGERVAGPAVEVPPQVMEQMRRVVPPPAADPPEPRPDGPPPVRGDGGPPRKKGPPPAEGPPGRDGPPRVGNPPPMEGSASRPDPPEPRPDAPPPMRGDGEPPRKKGPPLAEGPPGSDAPPAENQRLGDASSGRVVPPPSVDAPEPRRDSPPPERGDGEPPRKKGPPPAGAVLSSEDLPARGAPPVRKNPPLTENRPSGQAPHPADASPPRRGLPAESVFLVITHRPTRYWAGVRIPLRTFDDERTQPGILLFRSASLFNRNLFFDWRLWAGAVAGVVAVSVLCWLPFIRGLTRSIAAMDRATKEMAQGNFDVRVAHRRRDELGDLGQQVDRLGTQLGGFVRNQKRFLGDIAHELCAPIARIQFALGILEQKAEVQNAADALRPHVAVLHDEVQEMSGLVNELLQFSKAGLQSHSAPLAHVDVASVVRRAALRDPSPGEPFSTDVPEGLTAMAHEEYLLRAVSNLLRNALRYAGASGGISVTARREQERVAIRVADHGPGLPEGELEEVFAPFYRPEASRTRETGGAGLGLAIVKTCVEACGGTVEARNRAGGGLEVTISLLAEPRP